MITTGHPASPNTTKTEIVDVVSGEVCEDLAVFPIQNCSDAVGANLDGTPVVCGGYYFGTHHKICYKLTINGWQEFASMKDHRGLAAAVMFQKKFHVFGGWGGWSGSLKVGFFQKVLAKFSNLSKCHTCEPKIVQELLIPLLRQ